MVLTLPACFFIPVLIKVESIALVQKHTTARRDDNQSSDVYGHAFSLPVDENDELIGPTSGNNTHVLVPVGENDELGEVPHPDNARVPVGKFHKHTTSHGRKTSDYVTIARRFAHWFGSLTTRWHLRSFLGGCLGSTLLVMVAASDDIIWLLPFLSERNWTNYAYIYVTCMIILWVISAFIVLLVRLIAEEDPDFPIKGIVEVSSALLMIPLTVHFFHEWLHDQAEDEAETKEFEYGNDEAPSSKSVEAFSRQASPAAADHLPHPPTKRRAHDLSVSKLICVGFAVNLDNISVFVTIMLKGVFHPAEILVGDILARIMMILFTLWLSSFQGISAALKKIPLWSILAVLTFYTCSTAFISVVNGDV